MSVPDSLVIRPENAADHSMIHQVNDAAFGGAGEADLIESLRRDGVVLLSLVAEVGGRIVGHILFSRMSVEPPSGTAVPAVALAPLAVLPDHQRQGIGGQLIGRGLAELRRLGERLVIVVGHPDYYPRFGFSTAPASSIDSPFPPDVFMALELVPGALDGIQGRVRYPDAFGL
ncbi:MAG: N-acetyltransferase [Acidobacteriota bacterium]